ncbi:MAG: peptide chain release factor 1 [Cyanobacteria bacterium P01_F01_bin.86]
MRNPLWRLKTLPWGILLQNALLTVLLASLLDILLLLLISGLARLGITQVLPGGIGLTLLLLIAAGGVGALAVILMERFFRQVRLDVATLWALIGCLILALILKNVLRVPTLLVGLSQLQVMGLVVGLFAQSRSYWRR